MKRRKKSILFPATLATAGLVAGSLIVISNNTNAENYSAMSDEGLISALSRDLDISSDTVKESLATKTLIVQVKDENVLKLGQSLSIEQQEEGGLIIGGTREFADFEGENTFVAIDAMMKRAARFFPALRNVSVIRFFSGFRPYTPDGMPLLGPVKTLDHFYMAAGHEGDGIALSPVTGKLMAEYIVDGKPSYDISDFSPNRFLA